MPEPLRAESDGRSVLVVEDEPRLRDMLLRAIDGMDFEPRGAGSGEEALTLLEEEPVDILLADLGLPGIDGLELCDEVRRRLPFCQLVILTGFGDLEAAQRAIRLDVVDFLAKPVSLGDLESALGRALRRRLHHVMPRALRVESDEIDAVEVVGEGAATLEELERRHILDALARFDGNREETARTLGISVRTLYYRLRDYERRGFYHR